VKKNHKGTGESKQVRLKSKLLTQVMEVPGSTVSEKVDFLYKEWDKNKPRRR